MCTAGLSSVPVLEISFPRCETTVTSPGLTSAAVPEGLDPLQAQLTDLSAALADLRLNKIPMGV